MLNARTYLGASILAVLLLLVPTVCFSGPGSGVAEMWPKINAVAGTYDRWTLRYTATEDFSKDAGMVTIDVPSGWSAPQVSDSTAQGFIRAVASNPSDLDSFNISARTIRLYLGSNPHRFSAGEYVEVIYGASSSYARTQTTAPDSVFFNVKSDPSDGSPQALASGSPRVKVVTGPLARIVILFSGSEAGALSFTADQESNVFTTRGLDSYDNVIGGIRCTWGLTAQIGRLLAGGDSTIVFAADKVGAGYITALDSLSHVDSTGLVTVTHGAYRRLDVAQADTAVAGSDFPVSVAALDLDGNVITSGVGSNAALTLSAWRDSVGNAPASGEPSIETMNLSQGQGSVSEKYFVADSIYIRAVDDADTTVRDFGPRPTLIKPGPPSFLDVAPDTLSIVAGVQQTLTLRSTDSFGNTVPVYLPQILYVWTNSATGEFREVGGNAEIFEKTMPAGIAQVFLDYYDTGSGDFQIAVMDVDANTPDFPPTFAGVRVSPSSEDTLVVSGIPDPVLAGALGDVLVEVRDKFGNRVRDYDGTIHFSSTDTNSETILPDSYTFVSPDSGFHAFPVSVRLTRAGEQSVSASDNSMPSLDGCQRDITVLPGDCDSLRLGVSSSPLIAGERFDLEVEAIDEFENTAAGYAGTIRFLSSDTGDSTALPAPYTFVPSDGGAHLFSGVARLTTAGLHTISATDTSEARIDGAASGIEVRSAAPASIALSPPGSFYVNVGASRVLSAAARDAFGNAPFGQQVSVVIKNSADGSLEDDPANPNNTSGGFSIQTGATDSAGVITVLYRAPGIAGLSDTLDAYCSSVGHESVQDVFISSTPAGATTLRVLPAQALVDTAGAVFSISVEAMDSFGNLDTSDVSLVRIVISSPSARISVDGGSTWSTSAKDSLQLVSGSSQSRLKLKDLKAGNPEILAEDVLGTLIAGLKADISVLPALPWGSLAISTLQDSLTANGQASTTVVAGPLTDSYGNNVGPGVEVTVRSSLCQIVAYDADSSLVGVQLLTAADGKVSFALLAGSTAGSDTVSIASTLGTASGIKPIALLAPPHLGYVGNSISPSVVSAGQSISFELALENTGGSRVYLWPTSTLELSDGNDGHYAASLPDTIVVLPGAQALVRFDSIVVPSELDPGTYSPALSLFGRDGNASPFAQNLQIEPNAVSITAMRVHTISTRSVVTRGETNVDVQMTIKNEGDAPLEVTAAGLAFSSPGHSYSLSSPTLPQTLTGGETRVFSFRVDIDPYAQLGSCIIDGFASGLSGGVSVNDAHADSTATWVVQSHAVLSYAQGSLSRDSVSLGQRHSISIAVRNSGTSSVELNPSLTYLKFGAPGPEYLTYLASPTLVAGTGETVLHFAEVQVSPSTARGSHSVEILLSGTEGEASFVDTLYCDPESMRVELPATLQYVSISPETVSTGYSPAFSVILKNTGEATALILPQTRLRFGTLPQFETFLSESLTVEGDSLRTLRFSASAIDAGFATGAYGPELLTRIEENGIIEDSLLTTGSDNLLIQKRALLTWKAGSLEPSRVTVGQEIGFSLQIENLGDATAAIDPALCKLEFQDGTNAFVADGQGSPFLIASRGTAEIHFAQDTLPQAMAPQPYRVDMEVRGNENGFPFVSTVLSPQGELTVQSAPVLRYVYDSLKPDVVAQEQTVSFSVNVENTGDATLFVADTSFMSLASITDTVDCSRGCEVQGHSVASLYFKTVALDSTAISPGLHPASLWFEGRDWNGRGFSQTLLTSPDSVTVNKPGDLRIYSTTLNSPNAPRVDTAQAFTVEVEVENLGQEDAADVVVSLSSRSSSGGSIISSPVNAGLVQGGSKKKTNIPVRAGSAGLETFTAQIVSSVGSISGEPLSVGTALDDTSNAVIELPALLSVSISVSEPSGAIDETLSTQQIFKIRAIVSNTGQGQVATGSALGIFVPQGFVLLSPSVQNADPGAAVEWLLNAPSSPSGSSTFLIGMASVPPARNTGQGADTVDASKTLNLAVVNRADLSLDAAITSPPDAIDGSLHVNTPFTIEAAVSNLGTASTTGQGRAKLSLPIGYSLAEGCAEEQDFTIGAPVRWDVIAPSQSSPIQEIPVSISAIPMDENTSDYAHVSAGVRGIAVYVETKNMIADALPLVEAPPQIAPGENSIKLMALRIANPQEIGEGSAIVLRAIDFFVGEDDNTRLDDPSSALSSIKLSRCSSPDAIIGAGNASITNPVRVDLLPQADTLRPGESDTLIVMVDASLNPPGAGVTLEIESEDAFDVIDLASGQRIGVVLPDNETFPRILTAPSRWFTSVHNYPNPFKAGLESTRISYFLEQDSRVSIKIYTLDGKLVFSRTFSQEEPQGREGLREIIWDGKNGSGEVVLNGVYICKLEASGVGATFKIAVAK